VDSNRKKDASPENVFDFTPGMRLKLTRQDRVSSFSISRSSSHVRKSWASKGRDHNAALRKAVDTLNKEPIPSGKSEQRQKRAKIANSVLGRMETDRLENGGPYGTIFATFCCRHRQKCSVSCNDWYRWQCKLL